MRILTDLEFAILKYDANKDTAYETNIDHKFCILLDCCADCNSSLKARTTLFKLGLVEIGPAWFDGNGMAWQTCLTNDRGKKEIELQNLVRQKGLNKCMI